MNMDDIFSQFGDIFGSAFGGGGGFEAVVEASVELKEVTYQSKINFRRNCARKRNKDSRQLSLSR
jgi:DnaJ-class molecular chaperone